MGEAGESLEGGLERNEAFGEDAFELVAGDTRIHRQGQQSGFKQANVWIILSVVGHLR